MLLGNYSILNRNPLRRFGGSTASVEVGNRSNFGSNGAARNMQYVSMTTAANKQFALPYGSSPPYSTLMPQKGGDLSARRTADFSLAATAAGLMGYPIVGSAAIALATNTPIIFPLNDASPLRTGAATITISVLDADGQLISSGSGSASMAVTTNTPLLTASISGDGTTTFSITTNTPVLGAEASATGDSSFSFSVSGSMLPLNDASPLRTGTTVITISGSLTPYAIGSMIGTTDVVTELTTDSIASAVWSAIASSFNDAGTMGNKLNTASAGGVDLNALADAVVAALEATTIPVDAKKMNGSAINGNGTPGDLWRGA